MIHPQPKGITQHGSQTDLSLLQWDMYKGMILKSSHQLTIDCFVDADFMGQWNV